jgi:tetratricopeptide (TPR) repeat protein
MGFRPQSTLNFRCGAKHEAFARHAFERHSTPMDDHLKQLLLLGREHYQKREFDKAEYLLKQVVQQTDRFADVFDMLGVISHAQGDFAQAEQYFEKAVSLNPNYTEAQLNLMVTYNDLGKYDSAREIYARIRGRASGSAGQADPFAMGRIANMHAEISQAYQDAGMPAEAVLELERAVALCPTFADLRTRLATLYRDLGHKDRAREQLEIGKQHNPNYVQARVLLGVALLSAGEYGPAIGEFEAVLARDSEHKSAQMYLKIAHSQRGKSEFPPA